METPSVAPEPRKFYELHVYKLAPDTTGVWGTLAYIVGGMAGMELAMRVTKDKK